jgi:hypothetical protein
LTDAKRALECGDRLRKVAPAQKEDTDAAAGNDEAERMIYRLGNRNAFLTSGEPGVELSQLGEAPHEPGTAKDRWHASHAETFVHQRS